MIHFEEPNILSHLADAFASVKLPRHQHVSGSTFDSQAKHAFTPGDIRTMLDMRLVNSTWDSVVLKSFFSNVLVFPMRSSKETRNILDTYLASTGPLEKDEYQLSTMTIQHKTTVSNPVIQVDYTHQDEVVYLRTSRLMGGPVVADASALWVCEPLNSFLYRSRWGDLMIPVRTVKIDTWQPMYWTDWRRYIEDAISSHLWARRDSRFQAPDVLLLDYWKSY